MHTVLQVLQHNQERSVVDFQSAAQLRCLSWVWGHVAHLLCAKHLLPNALRSRLVKVGLLRGHGAGEWSVMQTRRPCRSCAPQKAVLDCPAGGQVQSCRHLVLVGEALCLTLWSCSPPSFHLVPPIGCTRSPLSCSCFNTLHFHFGIARARK